MRELSQDECLFVSGGLDQSLVAWGLAGIDLLEPTIIVSGSRIDSVPSFSFSWPDLSEFIRFVPGLNLNVH